MEYDAKGNLVKRTVVTEEHTEAPAPLPVWTTNDTKPRIDVTIGPNSPSVETQVQNVLNNYHNRIGQQG